MIIAISGKIGSGKDSIGKIIQELCLGHSNEEVVQSFKKGFGTTEQRLDSKWQIKKFADKLKDIVCLLIGCTREQLEDQEFKNTELGEEWEIPLTEYFIDIKPKYYTPRLLLQCIGTDLFRDQLTPNIWCNSLMSEYIPEDRGIISGKDYAETNWIITDLRFPNEIEAVKKRNGISIRVDRDLHNGNAHISTIPHESETALDNAIFDYVIENNGTIEELVEKVKQILIRENIKI